MAAQFQAAQHVKAQQGVAQLGTQRHSQKGLGAQ